MCGRFSLSTSHFITLKNRYDLECDLADWEPRYNIAPNQNILTIVEKNGKRDLKPMNWGLTPKWSHDKKSSFSLINARAESVAEKTMYKKYLQNQRCLIPADGFYEWMQTNGKKIPMRIVPKNDLLFSFAALWDINQSQDTTHYSATIITTTSNSLIQPIHDRMPVILTKETESIWLDEKISDSNRLIPLLKPFDSDEMTYYEVSNLVNSWKNDSPDCIKPKKHS